MRNIRRMPIDLQNQNVSFNKKNKRYYNDIYEFFRGYPNGISLSKFRIEFVRDYEYIPAVPSLTDFLKSCDIYAFYIKNENADDGGNGMDLYLLPMTRFDEGRINDGYKYPLNGLVLEGLPDGTTLDALSRFMKANVGNNYILRRGIDRFVVWYNTEQIAVNARLSFESDEIKKDGLKIVNDLPYLCNRVLTWVDINSLP